MNDTIPKHIAIIMDGNGRWARKRGLPRVGGHQAGIESVDEIVSSCRELGIRYLTLYSFSKENWARPKAEISFLMDLLSKFLQDRLDKMLAHDVCFNCIGCLDDLPVEIRELIRQTAKRTGQNQSL